MLADCFKRKRDNSHEVALVQSSGRERSSPFIERLVGEKYMAYISHDAICHVEGTGTAIRCHYTKSNPIDDHSNKVKIPT